MKRFDSSKWITKNKYGSHIEDAILTLIAENYIEQNLPKGILLEKISDDYKLKVKIRLKEIYEKNPELLQEGIWDTIKNTFAKLGNLTKGGTWNPIKGRKLSKKAAKEVETLVSKGTAGMVKDLDERLKEKYPKFPNMKSNEEFTQGLEVISAHYESIANAIKEGDLEEGTGNKVILELRKYLEKAIDFDLASVYRVFKEAEGDEEDALSGSRFSKTSRVFKSNKLPLGLALTGLTTAGLAWLANSDWLANLLTKETVDITQSATELTANVEPGEGMSQLLNRVFDNVNLSPTSTGAEFADAVEIAGGAEAMSGMFSQPDTAVNAVNSIINNPDMANMPLKDIFVDKLAGTGRTIGDQLVTVPGGTLKTTIINTVTKMVVTGTAKTAAIAAFGTSVLAPLGISLMAAGALTKLARVKGMKSSRFSAMESVLNGMKFVNGPVDITNNPEPLPPVEIDDKCIVKYFNTNIVIKEIISVVIKKKQFIISHNDVDLENNEYLTNISTVQISEEKQLIEAVTLIIECLDGRKIVINSIEEYWEKKEEIKTILEKYKIKVTITEEDEEEKDVKDEPEDKPVGPIDEPEVQDLKGATRASQIAMVLAAINPEANIYALIRADKMGKTLVSKDHQTDNSSLTNSEFKALLAKAENPKLKDLANLILALEKEKSENLRRMVNKAFGKEVLKKGARAKSTPGQARKGMYRQGGVAGATSLQEVKHLFEEYKSSLGEGIVTNLLPKFVNQSQIEAKKLEIAAMLGSMYSAEGSTAETSVPSLDLETLKQIDPNAEKELKGMGFDPTKAGIESGRYKFLGDVDRVNKIVSKNQTLITQLKRINTQEELKTLLMGLVSYMKDKLSGDKNQVKSAFFKVRNSIKEDENKDPEKQTRPERDPKTGRFISAPKVNIPGDTDKAFDILDRYPQIKTLLDKIDTVEEFRQLIALSIIPYTGLYQKFKGVGDFEGKPNPGLKSQIQSAIVAASNTFK